MGTALPFFFPRSLSRVAAGRARRGCSGRSRCGENRAPARGSRGRAAVSWWEASVARPALRRSPCRPRVPLAVLPGRSPPQRAGGRTSPARAALPRSAPCGEASTEGGSVGAAGLGSGGASAGEVGRLPRRAGRTAELETGPRAFPA